MVILTEGGPTEKGSHMCKICNQLRDVEICKSPTGNGLVHKTGYLAQQRMATAAGSVSPIVSLHVPGMPCRLGELVKSSPTSPLFFPSTRH